MLRRFCSGLGWSALSEQPLKPTGLPTRLLERPGAERVVLAHGFTQNMNCWHTFADLLAEEFELVFVDLPGHGLADESLDEVHLQAAGQLLLAAAGGTPAHFVGYSMGGRIAMHSMIDSPQLCRSVSLIGAHPGLVDPALRRREDFQKANFLEAQGLDKFLDDWLSSHMFNKVATAARCVPQRLENRPEGLAASLRSRGLGSQEHLDLSLENVDVPILQLVGQSDTRFISLASQLDLKLQNSSLRLIPGHHAAHLESPVEAAQVIAEFVKSSKTES